MPQSNQDSRKQKIFGGILLGAFGIGGMAYYLSRRGIRHPMTPKAMQAAEHIPAVEPRLAVAMNSYQDVVDQMVLRAKRSTPREPMIYGTNIHTPASRKNIVDAEWTPVT